MIENFYFKRAIADALHEVWARTVDNRMLFLHGTRRVGKTTLIEQESNILKSKNDTFVEYKSFENVSSKGTHAKLNTLLEYNLSEAKKNPSLNYYIILDEIQYVQDWQHLVKYYYDISKSKNIKNFKITLLGSSPIMMLKGKENLVGRTNSFQVPYWSYGEIHAAFGVDLDNYLYFGACPEIYKEGLYGNEVEWRKYYKESILDKFIVEDIKFITSTPISTKLFEDVFNNLSLKSGNIINFSTLIKYTENQQKVEKIEEVVLLMMRCGFFAGIREYRKNIASRVSSKIKAIALNSAFVTLMYGNVNFADFVTDSNKKGFLYDTVVGAHLYNTLPRGMNEFLYYWRHEDKYEIDYVIELPDNCLVAIEVKKTNRDDSKRNFNKFKELFDKKIIKSFTIGEKNCDVSIEEFLMKPAFDTIEILLK